MIFPEPSNRALIIGLVLWAIVLLLIAAKLWKWNIWSWKFARITRLLLVVLIFAGFAGFSWSRLTVRPPIIYPWPVASHGWTPNGIKSPLHILIRDYSSDPNSYVMSLSSLHNLSMTITVPASFTKAESGLTYYPCSVVAFKRVSEWNNQDYSSRPVGFINFREGYTLLLISASSTDANWNGFLAVRKKGNDIEWEGAMEGWANMNGLHQRMAMRETYRDRKKSVEFGGNFFDLTPELLIRYGVPVGKGRDDQCAEFLRW